MTETEQRQSGFTLIEVLVVVAIIGILGAVAVNYLGGTTNKARSLEVKTMFAEIRSRQLQYHNENDAFYSTGTSDTDYHPAAPFSETAKPLAPIPASWQALRLTPGKEAFYCGYVTVAGSANDSANIGATANVFGFSTAPARDWFYIVAECNFDGNAAVNSFYFTHSGINVVQEQNPGK